MNRNPSLRSSQRSRKNYGQENEPKFDTRKCSVTSTTSSYVSCVENFDDIDRTVTVTDQQFQRSASIRVAREPVEEALKSDRYVSKINKFEQGSFSNGKAMRTTERSELQNNNNNVYNRSTSAVTFADQVNVDHDKIDTIKETESVKSGCSNRDKSPTKDKMRHKYDHQQSDPSGDHKKGRRRSSIVQFMRRASSVSNTAYKNIKRALSSNHSDGHCHKTSNARRRSSIRIKHGVERPLIESVRHFVIDIIDAELNDIEFEEEKCSYHRLDIDKIRNTDDMIIRFLLEYFEDNPKASYLDRSCPIHGNRYYGQEESCGQDGQFGHDITNQGHCDSGGQRFEEIVEGKIMDMDRRNPGHECCGLELDEKETKMYQTCIKNVSEAIIETLKWRKEFGVNDTTNSDFPKELWTKNILVVGEDSDGSTAAYIRGCNYSKVTANWTPIFVKFLVHESEKILEKCFGSAYSPKNPPGNKPGIVIDCSGIGYAQVDLNMTLAVIPILTKHYPQSFSYIWVYEMPWIAKPLLSVAMKMLPTRHARKLRVIDKKAAICEMGAEGIPKFMGGKSDLDPYLPIPDDCGDIVTVSRKNKLSDCDTNKMIALYGDKKYYKNLYGI